MVCCNGAYKRKKDQAGIWQEKTDIFRIIERADIYFQKRGSLLLMHRNLALNEDEATAWYWLFNEWRNNSICKQEFSKNVVKRFMSKREIPLEILIYFFRKR